MITCVMKNKNALINLNAIASGIYLIRGKKVMLDQDLATLYGVSTKHLKRQVRRNQNRFPEDFMFELSEEESQRLRCQFGTLKIRIRWSSIRIWNPLEPVANCDR